MSKEKVRCAIYTRKSTSEGSDQEFTTLDAQRESCESYISSQKNQGWKVLKHKYDDFGYSGADTERPAVQKLLDDIKKNKVDCVVVYKVDRLSRSLLDFTKLLELFEKYNVTFVSTTQHFNTHTSMGRLTLNILLSFAQFEREMISERTRDKMAAVRKKGRWTGGRPALGYDLDYKNHKLIINPEGAEVIRKIFKTYIEKQSLRKTARAINKQGYRTKLYEEENYTKGGVKFKTSNLRGIIRNHLYIGKVKYKDEVYEGEHEAIISEDIFNQAQKIMEKNRVNFYKRRRKHTGLLTGMLNCKYCDCAMIYTYAKKKDKKYNYYICSHANKIGYQECDTKMKNAHKLEKKVLKYLRKISQNDKLEKEKWEKLNLGEKRKVLKSIVKVIDYNRKNNIIGITLVEDSKRQEFHIKEQKEKPLNAYNNKEIKKEPKLRQLLLLAHQIQELLDNGKAKDLRQVSEWMNISKQRLNQVLNFILLSPKIQEEILFSDKDKIINMPEYKMRKVFQEMNWNTQNKIWLQLKS